jgi:hypothetical protein
MQTTLFFLQVFLGVTFYFVFASHKYIVNGQFSFAKWKIENLALFLWSLIVCIILGAISLLDPTGITAAFKFVGISFGELEGKFNLSGVILGMLVAGATNRFTKPVKKQEDTPKKEGENEQGG